MDYNKPPNWRDHLKVHPAADFFPLLSETDPAALKELAEDIRQHGQREPASYIKDSAGNRVLLDGRNRLDALEMLGRKIDINDSSMFEQRSLSINAQAFIISKNIHRRHLTPDKKRDLIGLLLKTNPEKSDRSIAKLAKTSPTTVGAVRSTVQSGQLEKRIGADGKARKQPPRLKHTDPDCPDCGGNGYFMGGDSGRCYCHGTRPKKSTSPDDRLRSIAERVHHGHERATHGHQDEIEGLREVALGLERINIALESEIKDLKDEIEKLKQENARLRGENKELKKEVEAAPDPNADGLPDYLKRVAP